MEAISMISATADRRLASPQAQSELGGFFHELLRESARSQEAPVAAYWTDRPQDRALRRDSVSEPALQDSNDRSDHIDDYTNDFNTVEPPALTEPRRDITDTSERNTIDRADGTPPDPADQAGQASVAANTGTAKLDVAPDSGTPAEVAGVQPSISETQTSLAGGSGGTIPAAQAIPAFNLVPASATAQAQAVVAGPASVSASTQPSAAIPASPPEPTPAAAATNGQDVFARVSITPAPLVAPPTASLGGGAATAAIANASRQEAIGATGSSLTPAPGATNPSATQAGNQTTLGIVGPQGAAANTQALARDGQAVVAQSASSAAAAGVAPKQTSASTPGAAPASAMDASIAQVPEADQPQSPNQNGSAAQRQDPRSGASSETLVGSNTSGQGDGSKTTNSPSQDGRAAQQPQNDLTPKAQIPTPSPANSAPPALQGAQTAQAQVAAQAVAAGDARSAAGSAGPADTVSSQATSPAAVATGGIVQPAWALPGTFGSLSRPSAANPVPADQVAVEIQKAVSAGKDHVRVRLHPADLGQIDVSLKVRHDGTIRAVVTADRPETYDLLLRDARGLERALQDAGLKTDPGSLSFNLRGDERQGPNDGQRGPGETAQASLESGQQAEAPAAGAVPPPPVLSSHALDIRV